MTIRVTNPGRDLHSLPLLRQWLAGFCALFLLHLGFSLKVPSEAWVTDFGSGFLSLLAGAFAARIASGGNGILRIKWALVSLTCLARALGFGANFYGKYVLFAEPPHAWFGSWIFLMRMLPLLLALSTADEDDAASGFAWLDAAQTVLIGLLVTINLFPGLMDQAHPVSPLPRALWIDYSDTINYGILLLAAGRLFSAQEGVAARFYRSIFGLLLVFAPVSTLVNRVVVPQWALPAGSPIFLTADLPVLALMIGYFLPESLLKPTGKGKRAWLAAMIRFASPAALAIAALSLSMAYFLAHPMVGALAAGAGLFLYVLRTAVLQHRYDRAQSDLIDTQRELFELSRRDPLTGLHNRRWFDETLASEWRHAQRTSRPLGLLLIDIDHFKLYNDEFGHKEGDRCLASLAQAMQKALQREIDSLSRYGGEEFAVILPLSDAQGAALIAERIRRAVHQLGFPNPGSELGIVTVSIGAAALVPAVNAAQADALFLAADDALYRAKESGRNRIETADTALQATEAVQT